MDNIARLSHGSQVYAKKRKQRQEQPDQVVFDPFKRREFLTGFEKRKRERKKQYEEKKKEFERQDRLEMRKTVNYNFQYMIYHRCVCREGMLNELLLLEN